MWTHRPDTPTEWHRVRNSTGNTATTKVEGVSSYLSRGIAPQGTVPGIVVSVGPGSSEAEVEAVVAVAVPAVPRVTPTPAASYLAADAISISVVRVGV